MLQLRGKQRPAMTVNHLAAHDIETGTTSSTDDAAPTLNPLNGHTRAPEIRQVSAAPDGITSGWEGDHHQAPSGQVQHSSFRAAPLRETTDYEPF